MNPVKIDRIRAVFPTGIADLMPTADPKWKEYRDNWHRGKSWGFRLTSDLFHKGCEELELIPQDGIDTESAFLHIRTIMGSFEPKHEDKWAACALLFEKWFVSATWTARKTP